MIKKNVVVLVLSLLGLVTTVSAQAQTVLSGQSDGGAYFTIVVPDAWNGDLVIWNHGFSLSPIGPVSDLGPLADVQLAQGYAVAASSYQQRGWALFKTKNDLQNLVGAFKANFGKPNNVIVTGASLGGIVTVAAVEKANLGNVAGAFTFCGANAGSRNWDAALDLRLAYDAVCGDVPGASIPGGALGLPAGSTLTEPEVAVAVFACTGLLPFPPSPPPTPEQAARLQKILDIAQIPANFVQTNMWYVTFGMADLVHDQGKLRGKIGTGNAEVDYGDAAINATIGRVSPRKGPAKRLARNYTPNGDVDGTRHIALHTDKDGLVIVENQSEYASIAPASKYTVAVAVEDIPTHCGHTPAEVVAGWESLRGWLAGAPQPSAASIQGTCQAVKLNPLFPGPCRFDPTFAIPDIDGRIRPRSPDDGDDDDDDGDDDDDDGDDDDDD